MTLTPHRATLAGLCLCVLVGLAGCSDDVDDDPPADAGVDVAADVGPDAPPNLDTGPKPDGSTDADMGPGPDADAETDMGTDGGTATGLRLRGQLVPTGGLSLSNSFTLSGHLSPGVPEQPSSSASFQLKLTPTTTGN